GCCCRRPAAARSFIRSYDTAADGRGQGLPSDAASAAQRRPGLLLDRAGQAALADGRPERVAGLFDATDEMAGMVDVDGVEAVVDDDVGLLAGEDVLQRCVE